jgi:hypothetical protein
MKLTKELLGLAGEYAVASELCRRELYSQLTLGNHKRTDILVETDTTMLRISVKAKQDKEWPSIKGPVRNDDFLVLVDFENKDLNDKLDFYILDQKAWHEVLRGIEVTKKERISKIENGTIYWNDGFIGANIKLGHVIVYKNRWDIISNAIDPDKTEVKD